MLPIAPVAFIQVDSLWPSILALVVSLLLIMAEIIIPSGGILALLAIAAVVMSLVMAASLGTTAFLVMFLIVIVLVPVAIGLALKAWPKTYFGRRLFLGRPADEDVPSHSEAIGLNREKYLGKIGKTLTRHCPGGATEMDGRRIDTVSEGMVIDPDQYVRVIAVRGNRVVIRALPPDARPEEDTPPEDLGEMEIDEETFEPEKPEESA